MKPRIMLVGGAGYIGSVCAQVLRAAGAEVITYDNLSTGHREAVSGPLVVADVLDRITLTAALKTHRIDAVMHFAALALVGESVAHPLRYFDTNLAGTISLLQSMAAAGVKRLVFSSTCAVYGPPQQLPIDESHPHAPISPYGRSKDMVEEVLAACREREGFSITALRYFNAAGATPDGLLGESHEPESHLIPLALDASLGRRAPLALFGTDYPTRDGTCIRDYVHVLDLAQAHWLAVQRLLEGDQGTVYNLGTGTGISVREILSAIQTVPGRPVPHYEAERRPGDPPALFASSDKIRTELGWQPAWQGIEQIIETAARWSENRRY